MATIELQPHNEEAETWLLVWTERREIIGRVRRGDDGQFRVLTYGPHWCPMKSFAGNKFEGPSDALKEIQRYFEGR